MPFMRFAVVFQIALYSLVGFHAFAADKLANHDLVRTFTAKEPVKLNEAVAKFVIDLIHKNTAGVQDDYAKLTASTEEAAGGRYETHPFEGILWFVVEASWNHTDTTSTEAGEFIYLARQQLVAGFHRGFSIPTNVVAQVRVTTEYKGKTPKPAKEDAVPPGTKITLNFEGFLKNVPLTLPTN